MKKAFIAWVLICLQSGIIHSAIAGNLNDKDPVDSPRSPCAARLAEFQENPANLSLEVGRAVENIFPHFEKGFVRGKIADVLHQNLRPEVYSGATRPSGFTLIELLVVISVVAILSAVLLPALSGAKGMVKRVQCMNNQKQFVTASELYSIDNNDLLVANGRNDPPSKTTREWVQGGFVRVPFYGRPDLVIDPTYALFADYIPTLKTYHCPADREILKWRTFTYRRTRSYALNSYLGWHGERDQHLSPEYRIFNKASDIVTSPSGMLSFQDVNPDSLCWPFFGVYMAKESFFNFPLSSHRNGGILSYADGHVEPHQWQDPRTIKGESADYHMHDDSSPNNPDLRWLQERTTILEK